MSNAINQTIDPEPNLMELRAKIRHSAAHLLADAVTQLFPEAKLGIGPPTQDGFYYDLVVFLLSFRRIEMIKKVMQKHNIDQDPRYPFFHTHFKLL